MSRIRFLRSMLVACATGSVLLSGVAAAQSQPPAPGYYDASQSGGEVGQLPDRVARLAYLAGQVQLAPAGTDDWGSVEVNRPLVIGDRLLSGGDGLAVLELGDAAVRIDHDSAFDFLNLTQDNVQVELAQGTLNLAVHQLANGANFEVDTPTIAFVASTPGTYRIDNDPDGTGSMVTVFGGSGVVYGENGASRQVVAGTSYRFNDSTLDTVEANGLPDPDAFDRFCEARDADFARYARQERQYVSPYMVGGDDLYRYGQWNTVPQYGDVWYPNNVPSGWAPYRYGHWSWIDPWGWTWVDDQPWGFAPSHYGRWAWIGSRWGWMPGPRYVRPVYAPALVAFIGGSGFSVSVNLGGGYPVGWFPLGPRDVYVPWFHASRHYFDQVNVTNIRNVYVNQTVINNIYNDYRHDRYDNIPRHNRYAYRGMPGAVTAVPRDVFAGARPVHPAVLKLDRAQLTQASVAVRPDVDPDKASLGLRHPTSRPTAITGREPFSRPVVARHAPPPRPAGFAARQVAISNQQGNSPAQAQMANPRRTSLSTESRDDRVRLVSAPNGSAAPATPDRKPAERPSRNVAQPIPAHSQPVTQSGELAGARFAHPDESRPLPRPPVIRSASEIRGTPPGRLPVATRVEPAPQARGAATPSQQADLDARQTANAQRLESRQSQQAGIHAQQAQQQRQLQASAEAQARQQQADHQRQQQALQQREAQVRVEQQTRFQQANQQREAQMQAEQRMRNQRMQQPHLAQAQIEPRMQQPPMQPQRQPQSMPWQNAERNDAQARPMQRNQEHQAPRAAPDHDKRAQSRRHPDDDGDEPSIR